MEKKLEELKEEELKQVTGGEKVPGLSGEPIMFGYFCPYCDHFFAHDYCSEDGTLDCPTHGKVTPVWRDQ